MKTTTVSILSLALVSLLLLPAAAADHVQVQHQEGDRYVTVAGHPDPGDSRSVLHDVECTVGGGLCKPGYYQTAAYVQVHEESNGCPGLQTHPGDCDGDQANEPADTEIATLGCYPHSTRPCALPLPL